MSRKQYNQLMRSSDYYTRKYRKYKARYLRSGGASTPPAKGHPIYEPAAPRHGSDFFEPIEGDDIIRMITRRNSELGEQSNEELNTILTELQLRSEEIHRGHSGTVQTKNYKIIDTDTGKPILFVKIGRWSRSNDRNLQNERDAYERLEKYDSKEGRGFDSEFPIHAEYLASFPFEDDSPIGVLVLRYIPITSDNVRLPGTRDKDTVKKAIQYLADVGIVHLDITQNLCVYRDDGEKFVWFDFEAVHIQEEREFKSYDISYEDIYNKKMKDIVNAICDGTMLSTPKRVTGPSELPDDVGDFSSFSPSSPSSPHGYSSPSSPPRRRGVATRLAF